MEALRLVSTLIGTPSPTKQCFPPGSAQPTGRPLDHSALSVTLPDSGSKNGDEPHSTTPDGKPDHCASGTMILMQILPKAFYDRDAECVARDLLGKLLVRRVDHRRQIGRIVETEAYLGPHDLAAHSARGRTTRTEVTIASIMLE